VFGFDNFDMNPVSIIFHGHLISSCINIR